MSETDLADDVMPMFRRLKSLDEKSPEYARQRDQIAQTCLPVAERIARRYRGRGESHDDLVQVARMGLVHAINRFDVDSGSHFLSFAVPTMMGEVRRHFRDCGWALKVPRGIKELLPKLHQARAELSQSLGRAPTASEVAQHLGIDRQLVVEATIAGGNYATVSTDASTSDDDRPNMFADTLGRIDGDLDKVLDIESVRPLLAALPEREKTVIRLRFFHDMSQTQIAERLGCSQMHVSRLLSRALERVRDQLREPRMVQAS